MVGNLHALSKNLGCQYYPILRWFGRNVENQNVNTVWTRTLSKPAKLRLSSCAWPQHSQTGPYSVQVSQLRSQLRSCHWFGRIDFLENVCWFLIVLRDGCLFAPHRDSCAKLTRHQNCDRGCCICSMMHCFAPVNARMLARPQLMPNMRQFARGFSATKLHSIDRTSIIEDRMWWFSTWPWEAQSSLLWPSPCPLLSSLSFTGDVHEWIVIFITLGRREWPQETLEFLYFLVEILGFAWRPELTKGWWLLLLAAGKGIHEDLFHIISFMWIPFIKVSTLDFFQHRHSLGVGVSHLVMRSKKQKCNCEFSTT